MTLPHMTTEQFGVGWVLLTSQPWGRAYRGATVEATIQLELYYKHVNRANPIVWQAVCEHHAQGDHWPSLSELKASLTNNGGYAPTTQVPRLQSLRFDEAPWPLKACWTYQRNHECSLKDACLAVLPVWIANNPHHEDYIEASKLLELAQQNFGIHGQRGNINTSDVLRRSRSAPAT